MADTKISALTDATTVGNTDELPIVQSSTTKRATVDELFAATHAMYIPAGALRPTITAGCGALAATETTAGRPEIVGLPFDSASDEHAQFSMVMPWSWDESTITFKAHWTFASSTGTVQWAVRAVAISDDDTMDVVFGEAQAVNDTALTAKDMHTTPASSAIYVGGTPAAGDLVVFDVYRDVSEDTLGADATLLGVTLFITTNARGDA